MAKARWMTRMKPQVWTLTLSETAILGAADSQMPDDARRPREKGAVAAKTTKKASRRPPELVAFACELSGG